MLDFLTLPFKFLQPENVLLDGGPIPKVKLVDFGNAFTMSNENIIPDLFGNPEFSGKQTDDYHNVM